MYEKRLQEISKKIDPEGQFLEEYYKLINKKGKRGIYFRNNKKSIDFIRIKFIPVYKKRSYSLRKKIFYFLLKKNLVQPFLKKIRISRKLGDVVFIGGKIKGFKLEKKEVIAFPLKDKQKKEFIKSKKFKKKIYEKGFAPEVYKINSEIPYETEELLDYSDDLSYKSLFKRINKFYGKEGIEKINIKDYIKDLRKILKEKNIEDDFFKEILNRFSKEKIDLLLTTIHGDFAPEQALIKEDKIVFVDWNPKKDIILVDLLNFFRATKDIQSNKYFKKIIKIYPEEVKRNLKIYLVLSEISLSAKKSRNRKKWIEMRKERINQILSHD